MAEYEIMATRHMSNLPLDHEIQKLHVYAVHCCVLLWRLAARASPCNWAVFLFHCSQAYETLKADQLISREALSKKECAPVQVGSGQQHMSHLQKAAR